MKLTLSFLISSVILFAARALDYEVEPSDLELCKLLDQSLYAHLKVYDGRICYFTVINDSLILSRTPDLIRFREAKDMCEEHNKAHLLRIRTKEEALFVMWEFQPWHMDFFQMGEPVRKMMLGLELYFGGYKWDDYTNLTYKPDEWNGYHSGKDRNFEYVVMHEPSPKDREAVMWSSEGFGVMNASEVIGLVCQLEIQGTTMSPTTAGPALRHPTTGARDGATVGTTRSGWVVILALVVVLLLNASK